MKPNDALMKYPALFAVIVVASMTAITGVVSGKIIALGPLSFVGGLLIVSILYGFVDVLNELTDKRTASATLLLSALVRFALFLVIIPFIMWLPERYAVEGWYEVMGSSIRILLAGEAAILLSSVFFDIPLFAWMKKKVQFGGFFGRTVGTNIASNLLGSILFVVFAFWGIKTGADMWGFVAGQFIVKLALAFLIAPFTTLYVWAVRRGSKSDSGASVEA